MPRKKPIAIVVAMSREVAPLLRKAQKNERQGLSLFELESAVVVAGGIGRRAARRAAEFVVDYAQPELLISAGVAGALAPTLHVGDVLHAREVVDSESGVRFITRGGDCVLVSAAGVTGEAEKRALSERFAGEAVDMEAAAVAQVAQQHGLEFAAVKGISDELGFAMPPVGQFVDDAGQFRTGSFVAHLLVHPSWWLPVRELSRNTRFAAVKLSHALEHLIELHTQAVKEQNVSLY